MVWHNFQDALMYVSTFDSEKLLSPGLGVSPTSKLLREQSEAKFK